MYIWYKILCIDEDEKDDNLCDKCEDLKTIEYYYNTKKTYILSLFRSLS